MSSHTGEDAWEQLVLDEMQELDWQYTPGAEIAPGSGEQIGRASCRERV